MKKVIFFVILVAVIGAGFYLSNQKKDNDPITVDQNVDSEEENASENNKTVEVTYTDNGYSPSSIRVKVGTTVVFKNNSSRLMWTASDVHPTHEILPEFDPRRGIPVGESYSFTFDTPGTWEYHNHLRAADLGQIIVEE